MYVASVLFAEEFVKVVPIVFAYPGRVDGKDYIIAVLHPEKKSDVHLRKVPAKFKGFPSHFSYILQFLSISLMFFNKIFSYN